MSHADKTERTGLYRSRTGMVFGVCKGVAQYLDFSVFWARVIVIACSVLAGIWPGVLVYILAALLMKPEPAMPIETMEDEEFYHSYVTSRSMALHRLKRTFDNLERRIQRMENIVTARDYDWERRLYE